MGRTDLSSLPTVRRKQTTNDHEKKFKQETKPRKKAKTTMRLFHRVKSPANSLGSSSGDGDSNDTTIKAATAAATAASSPISSSVASTAIQTTNVQVVARIRPVIIKSSDESRSFFHVKSPSSRRRRLIGIRKKDSSGSTASETLSSSSSSSVASSISENIFEAWDVIDDDTAKQSSKTEQIKGRTNSYTLDRVFGTTSSTLQIYEQSIQPLVVSAMKGYHSTVLAYGQTSTGMLCYVCVFVVAYFGICYQCDFPHVDSNFVSCHVSTSRPQPNPPI